MSEAKSRCAECGAEILATTATRTGGLCMPCKTNPPSTEPPPTEEAIAVELEMAAASLRNRAEILSVPTRKIPLTEWDSLPLELRHQVPLWLRDLLSRHALHGLSLEYRDPVNRYTRVFTFLSPDDFGRLFTGESMYKALLDTEYVAVGYEQNYNLWLARKAPNPDSPVFLFEHSDWDGAGTPTTQSGLRFAAARLSFLICSMGVSEVSYYNLPAGSTRLIWKPDRSSRGRKA